MKTRRPYSYVILRYVHDPLSAEFVNVGLVMFAPETGNADAFLKAETRKTIGRMSAMFPDLQKPDFTAAMRSVDRVLNQAIRQLANDRLFPSGSTAGDFALRALPHDDSALQWSPVGTGLTSAAEETFERLYSRHVSRYDQQQQARRSDDEVWRPVRTLLDERNIGVPMEAKTIRSGDDEVEFQHAWKNGSWHVYQPISLDLADADGIRSKAHKWLGALTSLADSSTEPFLPHFIVGAPSDPKLDNAYHRAIRILQKAPNRPQIFEESQVGDLVDQIEDELRVHRAHF